MLLRIAIASDALGMEVHSEEELALAAQLHRDIGRFLLRHGLLVFADDADLREAVLSAGSAPQAFRTVWLEVLKDSVRSVSQSPPLRALSAIDDADHLASSWRNRTDLALVDPARAIELGVPSEGVVEIDGANFEVARLELALASRRARRTIDLWDREIPRNYKRDTLWRERFELIARVSPSLVIVDRFSGDQLRSSFVDSSRRRSVRTSGLEWFLKQFDRAGPTSVTLMTGLGEGGAQPLEDALDWMWLRLRGGGVMNLNVIMVENRAFGQASHARHIRFGPRHVVRLDNGLSVFESPSIRQTTPCSIGNVADARAREGALRGAAVRSRSYTATPD